MLFTGMNRRESGSVVSARVPKQNQTKVKKKEKSRSGERKQRNNPCYHYCCYTRYYLDLKTLWFIQGARLIGSHRYRAISTPTTADIGMTAWFRQAQLVLRANNITDRALITTIFTIRTTQRQRKANDATQLPCNSKNKNSNNRFPLFASMPAYSVHITLPLS